MDEQHILIQNQGQFFSQLNHRDLQESPSLQTISTTNDISHFPITCPPKIPLRSRKIRKISPQSFPNSYDNNKPLDSMDDSSTKPLRTKKRSAAQSSARVWPVISKPLSLEGELDMAIRHLKAADPLLSSLIQIHQPPAFDSFQPPFLALTKSIIFQQLACKAGTAIYSRFVSLCGGEPLVVPETMLALSSNQLRQMGISGRKATYLYDLASKYKNGILSDATILDMDDRSLFTMLTMVKGIGSWSVHMFMIFSLRRPDVLPVNDLGVRKGVQILYGLEELPRPSQMEHLCEKWRPYRSVGSWYMWRLVESKGASKPVSPTTTQSSLLDTAVQQQQQYQLQLLDSMSGISTFGYSSVDFVVF